MSSRRVFISHTSQEAPLALLLKHWIDEHFPGEIETFVSKTDINAGAQWLQAVEAAIRDASVVIVLCSPLSIRATWVIFEAGGAWGRGVPLLPICHSGLAVPHLPSPFSAFQALDVASSDFASRMARTLEEILSIRSSKPIDDVKLVDQARDTVRGARQVANRFDVFVSAPMSSLKGVRYRGFRKSLDNVLETLEKNTSLSRFYFAGKLFGDIQEFDDSLVGAKRDLRALASSDRFLMIFPEKLVTSSLVEAGFALALGLPSVLFVRDSNDLPYALKDIGQLSDYTNVHRYKKANEIAQRIAHYGEALWPSVWGRTYV